MGDSSTRAVASEDGASTYYHLPLRRYLFETESLLELEITSSRGESIASTMNIDSRELEEEEEEAVTKFRAKAKFEAIQAQEKANYDRLVKLENEFQAQAEARRRSFKKFQTALPPAAPGEVVMIRMASPQSTLGSERGRSACH